MTKKFSKLLLTLLLVFVTLSSICVCYAEVDGEKTKAVTTSEDSTAAESTIHNGDLYIFDNNIVMDKMVDGNVFLFGNNIEVTGTVNGNLFVFGNTATFKGSTIVHSIFACANSVNYIEEARCTDLYVSANILEMSYDSYVIRDLKSASSKAIIKAAIGRNANLIFNNIVLEEKIMLEENTQSSAPTIVEDGITYELQRPIIYGNLNYSSPSEIIIPKEIITEEGTVTYTKPSQVNNSSIIDILIGFATCIVTAVVIYIITKKCTPKLLEKISDIKISVLKLSKALGIGLISLFIISIVSIILLITTIGAKLAFILVLIYAALCMFAVPVFAIVITNVLKPVFKVEKTSMFYLILVLVSIVLYGITLIPFVGLVLGLIIKLISIGLILDMFIPHKELTEEEKIAIEEAKKQAKEIKEKRKQEKLEAKQTKKQAKLEEKETKQKEEN